MLQRLIEIIDFEKYARTFCVKRAEVVFLIGIVLVTEIVVHGNGFDDTFDRRLPERRDTRCDHRDPAEQVLAQFIIERPNPFNFCRHAESPVLIVCAEMERARLTAAGPFFRAQTLGLSNATAARCRVTGGALG